MKFSIKKMVWVVKLTPGLLLLSLACERQSQPNAQIKGGAQRCADAWDMYLDTEKLEKEVGEPFQLILKLKDGKDIVDDCNFTFWADFEGRLRRVHIYQWQSTENATELHPQGEKKGDILTFRNIYLYSRFANEDEILGQGRVIATTLPYVEGGRSLDSSLPSVFTKNRGVAGKFEFSPAQDAFVFSVENGKANSTYKIAIARGSDSDLESKIMLEKEITLDGNGRGQLDVPAFSSDCEPRLLARMQGADDRITFARPSYPCIEGKDGTISVNEQGRIEFSSVKTSMIRACRQPDNGLKGDVRLGLSYAKYTDFPSLKEIEVEDSSLSIDANGVLKGEVGVIPNYSSASCHYVKLSLSIYCCGFNARLPRSNTRPPRRPCHDYFRVSRKVGNGC